MFDKAAAQPLMGFQPARLVGGSAGGN